MHKKNLNLINIEKCKNCSFVCAYCRTQHSTEQFWLSSLLSSWQASELRCCPLEGRGITEMKLLKQWFLAAASQTTKTADNDLPCLACTAINLRPSILHPQLPCVPKNKKHIIMPVKNKQWHRLKQRSLSGTRQLKLLYTVSQKNQYT